MNPLFIPIGLLLLTSLTRRGAAEAGPGPAPTPPPGGTTPQRARAPQRTAATRAADQRVKQVLKQKATPKPAVTIEHPDVIPASHAPERAAVDAAVSQAIRDSGHPMPTPIPAAQAAPQPSAAPQASGRSPKDAAKALQAFLLKTGRFGSNSKTDRPQEVKDAQRDLGVVPDGIVGPKTRAAAKRQGVALPPVK